MSQTNFAALTADQKLVWSRDLWEECRDKMFMSKFMGGDSAIVQRITELTKTEKGEQVIFHLLADLQGDGIVGDNEREGLEEAMLSYNDKIGFDLISHGVRETGKVATQKTIIDFRKAGMSRLAFWLANRVDQLSILTLSGISYAFNTDGSTRTETAFSSLAFASDVSAPTTNRHRRWDATSGLVAGDTAAVAAADTLTYKSIVDISTYAKTSYLKPIMSGGKEYYVAFVRPEAMAQLKKDDDYQRAVVTGMQRSDSNPWFTGGVVTVDGLVLHEHTLVYNTTGAVSGAAKWGAGSDVDGARMLVCGPQALGFADLASPSWVEKKFQYDSQLGINVDKMFGLVKPKFYSQHHDAVEDFGVMAVDHAI